MLLRIILENFLSFDKAVQFDMFPNQKRTTHFAHIYSEDKAVPVLKQAAIYGANGAGKSNLIKGISFIQSFITDKNAFDSDSIQRYFYRLKEDVGGAPISILVEFVANNKITYIYDVKISKQGIESEALYKSGIGVQENKMIFHRTLNNVDFAHEHSFPVKNIVLNWIGAYPFSSLLTLNTEVPVISDVHFDAVLDWFDNNLLVAGLNIFPQTLIQLYKTDSSIMEFANKVFSYLNIGVSRIQVETEDFDKWLLDHDATNIPVEEIKKTEGGIFGEVINMRNTKVVSVENGIRKISQMVFEQMGKDGYVEKMDIQSQSDGTVRLLALMPLFYQAIEEDKTVFIDEIDHSIHPFVIRGIIRFFSEAKTKGQLIFTTHQTCLLNQEFMRPDEVWFIEKKEGQSYAYSWNDFKVHNTISIENGYLEGRYGAVPYIGSFDM